MAFSGTERQRDRKVGQKDGTKGHFPGTEWQRDRKAGQNVWDRRAGTECLGSALLAPLRWELANRENTHGFFSRFSTAINP